MSEKFPWMDKLLGHVPGLKGKLVGVKWLLGAWDTLSDSAKLEIANAVVEKLKKIGEDQ